MLLDIRDQKLTVEVFDLCYYNFRDVVTVELRIEGRVVLPMGLSNLLPGAVVWFLG